MNKKKSKNTLYRIVFNELMSKKTSKRSIDIKKHIEMQSQNFITSLSTKQLEEYKSILSLCFIYNELITFDNIRDIIEIVVNLYDSNN